MSTQMVKGFWPLLSEEAKIIDMTHLNTEPKIIHPPIHPSIHYSLCL